MEIARRATDAFNLRDIDGLAALTTRDFEWSPAMGAVEGEVFRAREGIATYWGRLHDAWEDYHVVVDEYRDLGDRVLVLGRVVGRGRGSGVPVDAPLGFVEDFRDGKLWRVQGYLDQREALRAIGLDEENPLHPDESTSPDLFALMRSAVEALNRRDFDVMPRVFAPDAVYDLSSWGLGVYEGLAAISALFEEWWSLYDELESEVEEVIELRNGVAFVAILQTGRPVGTTAVVEERQGWVMVVVDGIIVRVTPDDPDEARAAAERLAQEQADD